MAVQQLDVAAAGEKYTALQPAKWVMIWLISVDRLLGLLAYAMLNKIYGHETREEQRRYSPPECIGADKKVIAGDPDKSHVSTS